MKSAKPVAFAAFAVTFLLARVLASPFSVLWPALSQAPGIVPWPLAYTFVSLMGIIYAIQVC